jgi:capsid protein
LKLILNEFRRTIEQRQWLVLIPQMCQRIREAWFDMAVLDGGIEAPNYATLREDYVDTTWTPQGWPYSHPVQDVTADEAAVRNGFKSRSSVIYGNGDDPDEVITQIVQDNAAADANDLIFDSDPRYTSTKGVFNTIPAGAIDAETDDEKPAGTPAPAPAPAPPTKKKP